MTASKLSPLTLVTYALVLLLLISMAPKALGSTSTVEISDMSFNPQNIAVLVGDTVTWVNNDNLTYTLWFLDAQNQTYLFSDPIFPGDSWSCTFNETIALTYFCFDRLWITGSIEVSSPVHDVAVTNVVPSKTVVGQGFSDNVSVTVADIGDYTETFNITAYANATAIAMQNVTLASGDFATITFLWNTTGFAYGNDTISAYAWPVTGETNTANNNMTDGFVVVTIPGDINSDGTVNILDAIQVSNAFLATSSSSNWNPNADINSDGVVNILDAIILANHFLQHYP